MSPLLGRKNKVNRGQPYWTRTSQEPPERASGAGKTKTTVSNKAIADGWRFTLKGSPRHFDDVRLLIESDPGATVYFGEALAYERGAAVALWRISARSFGWLPQLYDWWAETERIEPIIFTFHLYLPSNQRYAALDLREQTPDEVEAFIKAHAPRSEAAAQELARQI